MVPVVAESVTVPPATVPALRVMLPFVEVSDTSPVVEVMLPPSAIFVRAVPVTFPTAVIAPPC